MVAPALVGRWYSLNVSQGVLTANLPSALDCFEKIRRRSAQRSLVLLLDYDGTLTPIVQRPELAELAADVREQLARLAELCKIGIVSGRDLRDVCSMVGLGSLYYAGSHGFELSGPNGWSREPSDSPALERALDEAEAALEEQMGDVPEAWVERKRFAIAVHYRQVAEQDVPKLRAAVKAIASAYGLRITGAKKVFELRPAAHRDKGTAAIDLLEALGGKDDDALAIYIGDDETDEDAFAALADRGISIVVARKDDARLTGASYVLRAPDEVARLLSLLEDELRSRAAYNT
jgi:trehalose-phosphatase